MIVVMIMHQKLSYHRLLVQSRENMIVTTKETHIMWIPGLLTVQIVTIGVQLHSVRFKYCKWSPKSKTTVVTDAPVTSCDHFLERTKLLRVPSAVFLDKHFPRQPL